METTDDDRLRTTGNGFTAKDTKNRRERKGLFVVCFRGVVPGNKTDRRGVQGRRALPGVRGCPPKILPIFFQENAARAGMMAAMERRLQ